MAMACTIAVESVIMEHYDEQMKALEVDNSEESKELLQVRFAQIKSSIYRRFVHSSGFLSFCLSRSPGDHYFR